MFHIDPTSVHFSDVLEAGTPYVQQYANVFQGAANSVVADSIAKAIFAFVLFFAIINIFAGSKLQAFKMLGTYFMISLLFYIPWVNGNYLFPAMTNILDVAVKNVCQFGSKGFSPYDLADESAIPEIALGSFDQVLQDEALRNRFIAFKGKCYGQAKKAYAIDNPAATGTLTPVDSALDKYYGSNSYTVNGANCQTEKQSLFQTVNGNYSQKVNQLLDNYRQQKITGGGTMLGQYGLSSNAQQMVGQINTKMGQQAFQDSVFNKAVEKAQNIHWTQSEDTRTTWEKFEDGLQDMTTSNALIVGRTFLAGIFSTAKWFFDRHLYDIVGSLKLCICMAFPFLFLYALFTLNPDPLIKLLGFWLFADSLYIIASIQQVLWYSWGGGNIWAQLESLIGLETIFSHALAVSGFLYLFSFSLAGIFTWNALMGGSALFGPFAGGLMAQLKMLPGGVYHSKGSGGTH